MSPKMIAVVKKDLRPKDLYISKARSGYSFTRVVRSKIPSTWSKKEPPRVAQKLV